MSCCAAEVDTWLSDETSPTNPQMEVAVNSFGPARQTMAATETQERGMSASEQPVHDDASPRARIDRRVILGAGLVTLVAAAGIIVIVTNGDHSANPQPVVTGPPTASTPQATPEEAAAALAEARYREFVRLRDTIGTAGFPSAGPFKTVAVPPELTVQQLAVRSGRTRGLKEIGATLVASVHVALVDLSPPPGGYPKVVLQACLDVSGVNVVDRAGHSVVTADRAPRSKSTVTMYRYATGTPGAEAGGWYVYEATAKNEPC
jgi:hypothetical protein